MGKRRSKANRENIAPLSKINEANINKVAENEGKDGSEMVKHEESGSTNDDSMPVIKVWEGLEGERRQNYIAKMRQFFCNRITAEQFREDLKVILPGDHRAKHNDLMAAIIGRLNGLSVIEDEQSTVPAKKAAELTELQQVLTSPTVSSLPRCIAQHVDNSPDDGSSPIEGKQSTVPEKKAAELPELQQVLTSPTVSSLPQSIAQHVDNLPLGIKSIAARLRYHSDCYNLKNDGDVDYDEQVAQLIYKRCETLVKSMLSSIILRRINYNSVDSPDSVVSPDSGASSELPHEENDVQRSSAIRIDRGDSDIKDDYNKISDDLTIPKTENVHDENVMYSGSCSMISVKDLCSALNDASAFPCSWGRVNALEIVLSFMFEKKD